MSITKEIGSSFWDDITIERDTVRLSQRKKRDQLGISATWYYENGKWYTKFYIPDNFDSFAGRSSRILLGFLNTPPNRMEEWKKEYDANDPKNQEIYENCPRCEDDGSWHEVDGDPCLCCSGDVPMTIYEYEDWCVENNEPYPQS